MVPEKETAVLTKEAAGQLWTPTEALRPLARLIARELKASLEPGKTSLEPSHLRWLSCDEEGRKG